MPIRPGIMLLGRSADCDGVLGGSLISRKHARLVRNVDSIDVVDERSSNGVHVNGRRCSERRLRAGDVLRLADHVAVLVWGDAVEQEGFGEIKPGVWGSQGLQQAYRSAEQVAQTRLPVLIQGESGTGKEALARFVHETSRRSGNFVALSCATLVDGLLEAELFGHERGAFTGADRARDGYLQRADRGTLFLDEVGELSPNAQAKLLRVIQEGEAPRVGGRDPVRVEVRWVAATHRDLTKEVEAGRFRLDLYHRLAGLTVRIPPLRERPGDILPLLRVFTEPARAAGPRLSETLVEALCTHAWPGNVRELRRVAESMLAILGANLRWEREHLPREILALTSEHAAKGAPAPGEALDDRAALLAALRATRGNLSTAAKRLGRSRQALYTALKRHGLSDKLDEFRKREPTP